MNVWAVYFSATGTTKRIVTAIAQTLCRRAGVPCREFDFTLPAARNGWPEFMPGDLVVFGVPVYAGRVPNVLLKYLGTAMGNGAFAVPVVLYGNRNFDDALIELRDILADHGFLPFAAAAFVGEHAFSYELAKGRPDERDLRRAEEFAERILKSRTGKCATVDVPGTPRPYRGYYMPHDGAGNPIDIRKVKPLTSERCDACGECADVCPVGGISRENVRECTGICIKCGACVKGCHRHAKYFEDEGYLCHLRQLEREFGERREPELFL